MTKKVVISQDKSAPQTKSWLLLWNRILWMSYNGPSSACVKATSLCVIMMK